MDIFKGKFTCVKRQKNRFNKIMDKFNFFFFFCSHQALSTITKLIIKKILCFAFTVKYWFNSVETQDRAANNFSCLKEHNYVWLGYHFGWSKEKCHQSQSIQLYTSLTLCILRGPPPTLELNESSYFSQNLFGHIFKSLWCVCQHWHHPGNHVLTAMFFFQNLH